MQFSATKREEYKKQLQEKTFDILVVGGGITGAGVALQAAASGLTTAIIDMQDFSEGTSSRSTKLVHGGIRYLKTFDVDVVADTVTERARLQHIAPHIPKPSKMVMPIYDEPNATFTPFSAKVAMEIYDKLASVPTTSPFAHKLLSATEAKKYVPNLNTTGLKGVAVYLDYQNNDARLTIENIKQAVTDGAIAVSHLKAIKIKTDTDHTQLVTVHDQLEKEQEDFVIHAKTVVNAAGPWEDQVRALSQQVPHQQIRPTKGVHLVVDHSKLPVTETVYFDSGYQDGRMLFVIPREGKTYFGTTDTDYQGDYRNPQVEQADVTYLLGAINQRFSNVQISVEDIEASWAGLRPLMQDGADYNGNQRQQALTDDDIKRLHQDTEQYLTAEKTYDELLADLQSLMVPNEQPSAVSRGFDIEVNQTNIVNILGGKLTDYRLMASEATKKVAQILSEQFQHSVELIDSTKYQISGGHFNPDQVENHLREYETLLLDEGVTRIEAKMMANLYGSNVPNVMTYLKNQQPAEGLTRGQTAMLHYAIHEEMVTRPIDFVWRRTNYLLFHSDVLSRIESALINEMARVLSWTQSTKQAMIEEYQAARDISALKHLKERENING